MKNTLLLITASALSASAVTSAFSAFGVGNQTVLADSTGVATNGLFWGILVDIDGSGFEDLTTTSFGSIDLSADTFIGSDFFIAGDLQTLSAAGIDGSATTVMYDLNSSDPSSPVIGGENFALFWSDDAAFNEGDSFGFVEATGLIPTSNANNDPTTEFRGVDPNLQTLTYVPEPSSAALLGLGGLALVARRRR